MGRIMGGDMSAWILLWIILGVAVVVTAGVVVVRHQGSAPLAPGVGRSLTADLPTAPAVDSEGRS